MRRRILEMMTDTFRTTLWAVAGGALGGIAGGVLGNIAHLPGAGPIGIGLTIGALAGFLLGLPKNREE